ncbi:MnhB domain-containing protein [Plebeiibacterium marinum]|uniref:Cation:proton antiporter n=1 Tax=Plebeiibacterium marinum TaxID=2992111 RepID=A0AAE3SIT1_9BACT|nr:MnhB domain-containing protein [Plebeiobacterium marinum]MCW3804729.1 cation:proton antiporter [Plebeiobacterium marinum]
MNSVILQIATRYLKVLFLSFACIAVIRGHNYPGGGFIGGLLAALYIVYSSLAFSVQQIRRQLKVKPQYYIGLGLLCALLSFMPSLVSGAPLMKGIWFTIDSSIIGKIKLGSPLLFDFGVFFTVMGVTLLFLFTLSNHK